MMGSETASEDGDNGVVVVVIGRRRRWLFQRVASCEWMGRRANAAPTRRRCERQESLADDQGSNLKPALGTRWTSVPHRRLRLCKIPGTGWNSCGVVYGVTAAPARYRIGSNNIHSAPS